MIPALSVTLREPLILPVEIIEVDGLPKIIAGNVPVTPLNVVLKTKAEDGATKASVDTYARAGRLFSEFAAHRGRALTDVTDAEFTWFKQALQGHPFPDAHNRQQSLSGRRNAGTADTTIALLYSIAADLKDIYGVRLDWHRYRGVPTELVEIVRAAGGNRRARIFRRAHRVPHTPPKVLPLPQTEFEKMIVAAHKRWGNIVVAGDMAHSQDPSRQKGALFCRNVGILFSMRFGGARRSEPAFITLDDVDREQSLLWLVTKGHGGEKGERLPVVLNPLLEKLIWLYVTRYRPVTEENSVKGYPVFVSHGTANYGRRISSECVRKIVDVLSPALTPPWDELVTPHTMRHRYSVDLQQHTNEAGTVINMRHASFASLARYRAAAADFVEKLTATADEKLAGFLLTLGLNVADIKLK
ncbi:MAG: hypothetical protein DMF66_14660 [Acidobacteria bacterium]|nr:MAG: hypothetical protein DMF66_14660 [Acidobacteriota bacterium]